MTKLTTKELNTLAFNYILDSIKDIETFKNEYDVSLINDKERVDYVYQDFKRVANHPYNMKKIPNEVNRFADWLMGMPGVIDIEVYNYRIIEIAKEWGSIPEDATESQEEKILSNWFNFIANKFFQLKKRLEKRDFLNA